MPKDKSKSILRERLLLKGGSLLVRFPAALLILFGMAEARSNVAIIQNISIQKKSVEIAKQVLKIEKLRDYQLEALLGLLQGRDVVVSQPTGSGKSVVYQLFPYVRDIYDVLSNENLEEEERERRVKVILTTKKTSSIALIIQPLISLMKDQIHALEAHGIAVCRLMHSSESTRQQTKDVLNEVKEATIVLGSPEAVLDTHRRILRSPELRGRFACVAIDEGHCIVKWGSNSSKAKAFRQDYSQLAEVRSFVSFGKRVPFVALTATALPNVERAIIVNLQMHSTLRLIRLPDRPNIRYSILRFNTDNLATIFLPVVEEIEQHGPKAKRMIIFCRSHSHCRGLFRFFDLKFHHSYPDYTVRPYAMFHAGTDEAIKDHVITSMSDASGSVRLVFATTAFGMGVDCKGLHHVIHFGPPNDIDDYLQESGRAGRDDVLSHALLLLYPKCTSGKVSPQMKLYAKNVKECRRESLLKLFSNNKERNDIEKHLCCDVCSSSCHCSGCGGHGASLFGSFMETHHSEENECKTETPDQPQQIVKISEEGEKVLEQKLLHLRNSVVSSSLNSIVGTDISSGFPLCSVKEIIDNCNKISSANEVWHSSSLLDKELSGKIYSLILDVQSQYGAQTLTPKLAIVKNSHESTESSSSDNDDSDDDSDDEDSDAVQTRISKYRANFRIESDVESCD